jgi:hypothetical protein
LRRNRFENRFENRFGAFALERMDRCGRRGTVELAIKRVREASPLWVWLAIAILFIGAMVYAAGVAVVQYLIAAG